MKPATGRSDRSGVIDFGSDQGQTFAGAKPKRPAEASKDGNQNAKRPSMK